VVVMHHTEFQSSAGKNKKTLAHVELGYRISWQLTQAVAQQQQQAAAAAPTADPTAMAQRFSEGFFLAAQGGVSLICPQLCRLGRRCFTEEATATTEEHPLG